MTSFFFYDLETSGFNPRSQRIMQFAGQRTDLDLQPVGEPFNILIKLTDDILPDPDALLVTKITPQKTRSDGLSEKEFLEVFHRDIATPDTVFVGFNSIRFDDEFMRSINYRNLYDPYEWQWKDGRSKWDMLDVVRMTRALRPDGIKWPVSSDGVAVNRLENIAALNDLEHEQAHDALSDVFATIGVAKLIQTMQPKLFSYLFDLRQKNKIKELLSGGVPIVYTSGRYQSEFEKTTVVAPLGEDKTGSGMYVYDLRYDPESWKPHSGDKDEYNPVKLMKYNHCPALAPISVLDSESWARIGLNLETVNNHFHNLDSKKDTILDAQIAVEKPIAESILDLPLEQVDERIYDGFYGDQDKRLCSRIRQMQPDELVEFNPEFVDKRLSGLYFLYKARQFPKSLLAEDREKWEQYIANRLLGGGDNSRYAKYMKRLQELAALEYLDADKRYVLEELALYAQSVVPLDSYSVN
ncbi:exodeoxyribonuclease I [Candidatus Saccharibacteria bacterium]|nr:exodeoxyribonuclease I [Candidatus Saccharibacteria bacterium]